MKLRPNAKFRYGKARWATLSDIKRADLFTPKGLPLGYWGQKPVYIEGDAPVLTLGGSGSGKTRDLIGRVLMTSPKDRMLILDPKGELATISYHVHAVYNNFVWHWNPLSIAGLPNNSCNLLDILNARSPTFHGDCKFIAESLIPLSGASNAQYFEKRARSWVVAMIKHLVESYGTISLPLLYELISCIESDIKRWSIQLDLMLRSSYRDVRKIAGEILNKQQGSEREFGSIMGEIYANLDFLDDPKLSTALEGGDFSLKVLMDLKRVHKVFLNVPAEYIEQWSPVLRLFFTVAQLYKSRHPKGKRLTLIVDEAGQLGRFEALIRAFTFGRGAGIKTWALFQDAGQIVRHYSKNVLQSLMGSAQTRQFIGVRDYDTALLASNMLGTETLEYIDPLDSHQNEAREKEALISVLQGTDILDAAQKANFHHHQRKIPKVQQRQLMTPSEILNMPEDRQILFVSGKNIPPLYLAKYPYYSRPELAGKYLPNLWHPPTDRITMETGRGTITRPIIQVAPPNFLRSFPQYRGQPLRYVKGYNPYIRRRK